MRTKIIPYNNSGFPVDVLAVQDSSTKIIDSKQIEHLSIPYIGDGIRVIYIDHLDQPTIVSNFGNIGAGFYLILDESSSCFNLAMISDICFENYMHTGVYNKPQEVRDIEGKLYLLASRATILQ
jgi:hypothetical protein